MEDLSVGSGRVGGAHKKKRLEVSFVKKLKKNGILGQSNSAFFFYALYLKSMSFKIISPLLVSYFNSLPLLE
jgi:hypothetical protein